jgi:hypothetical protein
MEISAMTYLAGKLTVTITLAAALIGSAVVPAAAQSTAQETPFLEVSAGYQLLHVGGGDSGNTYPVGFSVAGARYFSGRPLGLVAELGWSRDSTDVPGISVKARYFHLGGGPRFLVLRDGTLRPHVQVLAGLSRASFGTDISLPGSPATSFDDSDTAFMVQPGVGVTINRPDSRVGLALAVDYRRAFFNEGAGLGFSDTNEFRFFVGVRFGID